MCRSPAVRVSLIAWEALTEYESRVAWEIGIFPLTQSVSAQNRAKSSPSLTFTLRGIPWVRKWVKRRCKWVKVGVESVRKCENVPKSVRQREMLLSNAPARVPHSRE